MKTPRRHRQPESVRHSSRVAAAVLAGLVLAAYANIVFTGETLVATSNYHPFDYRFDRLRTGNVAPPALNNWHDEGSAWWQWEPAAKFFHAALRKGRFPLWDPTIAGGVDAHVNATQGQYFPPHVVLLLAGDTPALRDLYSLLLVWISGACCLLLLRRRGFHWLSALFFGVSYSLGGSMTFNLNTILGQTCAMIPVLLLAVEELLDAPSRRRVAATAIAAGLLVLASFLPIVVSGLLLAGVRLLAEALAPREGVELAERDRTVRRARRAAVAAGFAALLLGVALAAFLLLPVKLAGSRSKAFDSWYSGVGLHHYHAQDSLTLVSPIVSWDVWQVLDPAYQLFRKPDWYSSFFYVGLVPILLAVFAAPARVRAGRSLFLFLLGAAALLLLKLLGVPPVQWIGKLPVLRNIHFIPYFCGALAVAIGGLAALGVESLIRRPPGRWRIAAAAGLAAAVFAGIAWFAVSHGFNPAASLRRWVIEVVRLGVLAAILLVVLVLRARGRLSGSAAGALAVALLALELVPLAFHRRFQRHDVWTDPPDYVRFLQSDPNPGRVHSVHDLALTANVFQGLGLSGISSRSTFNAPRYVDLLRRYFPTSGIIFPIPTALLPNRRGVLDLLGVKSLIVFSQTAAGDGELKAAGLEWAHKDGEFEVYRNPTAWPRAYLTSSWSGASDPAVALEAVGKLESPDRVVLERRPLFVAGGDPPGPAGKCEIVEDGGDDL
ncbi:MAG TPA: hypothetical protein VGQ32_01210, partial [Thermoanaerobaculia bacterium]|nr:hypothetical protein [Thermoanaerobaculia bacterium]